MTLLPPDFSYSRLKRASCLSGPRLPFGKRSFLCRWYGLMVLLAFAHECPQRIRPVGSPSWELLVQFSLPSPRRESFGVTRCCPLLRRCPSSHIPFSFLPSPVGFGRSSKQRKRLRRATVEVVRMQVLHRAIQPARNHVISR